MSSILFTQGASTSSNKDDVKRDRNNRDRHSDSGNSSSDSDSTRSSIRESREKEKKKHSKKEVKEKKEKKEKKGKDKKDKDKKKKHKKDRKVSQMKNGCGVSFYCFRISVTSLSFSKRTSTSIYQYLYTSILLSASVSYRFYV